MHDNSNPNKKLAARQAERIEEDSDRALQEKAFRRAVARGFCVDGKNTAEIAAQLNCDEARVWNVLDVAKRDFLDLGAK